MPGRLADNVVTNMKSAGIAVMESSGNYIHGNSVTGAKYGMRLSLGSSNNTVEGNEFYDIVEGEEQNVL